MSYKVLFISILFVLLLSQIVIAEYGTGRNYFSVTAGQLNCYPTTNETTIYPGTSGYQNITVWHSGGDYTSYYANHSSNMSTWVSFSWNDTFIPVPPTINYTTANITVPEGTSNGVRPINISSNSSDISFGNCTTLMYVNVSDEIVMDTSVVLDAASKRVDAGERVYATITITKIRGPPGPTNVNLTYWLRDPDGSNFDSTTETVAVTTTWSEIRYRTVPSGGQGGTWTYYATAEYDSATDTGTDTFTVVPAGEEPSRPTFPTGGGGGIIPTPAAGIAILEFPQLLIIRQGDIQYANILVENSGETVLSGTHVVVQGISSEWYTIDPEEIDIIKGEKQNFVVKFQIPEDAYIKDYPIQYKAISGYVSDYELAIFTVREKSFEPLRIKDISTSRFVIKERGDINITLINQGTNTFNTTVKLDFPDNFLVDKYTLNKIISGNEEKTFEFTATSDISGTFSINVTVTYDNRIITKEIILNVYPPLEIEVSYITIIILAVIIIPLLLIIYLRRKRGRYRRRERLAEIKYIVRGR